MRHRIAQWYTQPLPPAWKTVGFTVTVLGGLGYVACNAYGVGLVLSICLTGAGLIGALIAQRRLKP